MSSEWYLQVMFACTVRAHKAVNRAGVVRKKTGLHLGQLRLEVSFRYQGTKSRDSRIEKCQVQEKVLDKKSRFRQIQCVS